MSIQTSALLVYGLTALGLVLLIPHLGVAVVLGGLAIPNMIWAPPLIATGWGEDGTLPIAICLVLLLIAAITRRVASASARTSDDSPATEA